MTPYLNQTYCFQSNTEPPLYFHYKKKLTNLHDRIALKSNFNDFITLQKILEHHKNPDQLLFILCTNHHEKLKAESISHQSCQCQNKFQLNKLYIYNNPEVSMLIMITQKPYT